jgi:hypothetical protein
MSGAIFKHNNVIALGEETFTGSKLGIKIDGLNDRILFVKAAFTDVDTGGEAAASLALTEVIAVDGKSFSLYAWDAAGAAAAVSRRVSYFAVIQ